MMRSIVADVDRNHPRHSVSQPVAVRFQSSIRVPAGGCPALRLGLASLAQDDIGVLQAWLRNVAVTRKD
jgi:hypothetical protein